MTLPLYYYVLGTPLGVGRPKFHKPSPDELLGDWPG